MNDQEQEKVVHAIIEWMKEGYKLEDVIYREDCGISIVCTECKLYHVKSGLKFDICDSDVKDSVITLIDTKVKPQYPEYFI